MILSDMTVVSLKSNTMDAKGGAEAVYLSVNYLF